MNTLWSGLAFQWLMNMESQSGLRISQLMQTETWNDAKSIVLD